MPKFSVVLATRDRPKLFGEALDSVIGQSYWDFEVIVVNDGSSPEYEFEYEKVYAAAQIKIGERLKIHRLVRRAKGHGQSYSINYGVDQAVGEFVSFLDDDDTWTDMDHLARAASAIENHSKADLYMTNQRAYLLGDLVAGPIWVEALAAEMQSRGTRPDNNGFFLVSIADLMQTKGFCHMNCLTVRREHFLRTGGMDEGIRWECDRDLFLRLIDQARIMLHHPAYVSHHNVPDPAKTQNMTTAVSMLEKRLLQIRVLDKAAVFANSVLIRRHGRLHKAYVLKKIAKELAERRQWDSAAYYARQGLGAAFGLKWLLFTAYCMVR